MNRRAAYESFPDDEHDDADDGAQRLPWWAGSGRLAVVLCLVGVGFLGFAVFGLNRGDAKAGAYPTLPSVVPPTKSATELVSAQPTTTEPREIVVSVVGAVRRPGLTHLIPGARVADAIEAAGGLVLEAETAELNLAQRLEDGDQVVVGAAQTPVAQTPMAQTPMAQSPAPPAPRPGPAPRPAPPVSRCDCGAGRGGKGAEPLPDHRQVSVNTASELELDSVPGIGKGIAKAIVQYRAKHGRIRSLDELAKIKEVGPRRLPKLRPYLRL